MCEKCSWHMELLPDDDRAYSNLYNVTSNYGCRCLKQNGDFRFSTSSSSTSRKISRVPTSPTRISKPKKLHTNSTMTSARYPFCRTPHTPTISGTPNNLYISETEICDKKTPSLNWDPVLTQANLLSVSSDKCWSEVHSFSESAILSVDYVCSDDGRSPSAGLTDVFFDAASSSGCDCQSIPRLGQADTVPSCSSQAFFSQTDCQQSGSNPGSEYAPSFMGSEPEDNIEVDSWRSTCEDSLLPTSNQYDCEVDLGDEVDSYICKPEPYSPILDKYSRFSVSLPYSEVNSNAFSSSPSCHSESTEFGPDSDDEMVLLAGGVYCHRSAAPPDATFKFPLGVSSRIRMHKQSLVPRSTDSSAPESLCNQRTRRRPIRYRQELQQSEVRPRRRGNRALRNTSDSVEQNYVSRNAPRFGDGLWNASNHDSAAWSEDNTKRDGYTRNWEQIDYSKNRAVLEEKQASRLTGELFSTRHCHPNTSFLNDESYSSPSLSSCDSRSRDIPMQNFSDHLYSSSSSSSSSSSPSPSSSSKMLLSSNTAYCCGLPAETPGVSGASGGGRNPSNLRTGRRRHLLQFIMDLLSKRQNCVQWVNRCERVFQITHPDHLTRLWGQYKNNARMTFDSLSRSLRLYYGPKKLERIQGRRNQYRLLPSPGARSSQMFNNPHALITRAQQPEGSMSPTVETSYTS